MSARAGIVVTGTEVLTGRVSDRNGPWLAEQLRLAGVDVGHIVVVGDRPEDMQSALSFVAASGVDLVITSGGLGPTADDLTAEIVARFQGRELGLDEALQKQIAEILERLTAMRGWSLDPAATAAAVRKQAHVPEGASVLAPSGTAPGLVVPPAPGRSGPPVVVLPGPPWELRRMWPQAMSDPTVTTALKGAAELRQRTIRLWGAPESQLAATLREYEGRLDALEISTCLRNGELEIVTRFEAEAQGDYDAIEAMLSQTYAAEMFSTDGRTVDDIVADQLLSHGLTIATAESCTAGLLASRLTERAGSSAYVLGGVVAYANDAKQQLLGVPGELLERVGAVSAEVANAMAQGARARFGSDIGVGITGIAGPGGGTDEKPVGLVHLCVVTADRSLAQQAMVPGSRADVRHRSVLVAMHMLRELLT